MESPKILVIVLIWNGVAEFISDCFSSLEKVDYPKERIEILAIDNASTDESVSFIKKNYPQIKLIINDHNLGFAAGNNVGLRYAIENNFDYVYLLNQDTVVDPNFLNQALVVIEKDKAIGAVQSKLLLHQKPDRINSLGNEIHYLGFAFAGGYLLPNQKLVVKTITYPSGACTLFRVQALDEVGLFNEEFFMYHEDTDLGWRFWLSGWQIFLAPESIVYHKYEFSRSIDKLYYMERNRYLVMLQNYKIATLLIILPAACLMDLAMFFYSFINGWWRQELKVYAYFFRSESWDKIIKTRQAVQRRRKLKDQAVIKRFTGQIDFQDIQNPLLKYIANPLFNFYWQIVKRLIFW